MTVKTSNVEPTWPTSDGAKVIEYSGLDDTTVAPEATETTTTTKRLPPDLEDRYGLVWVPELGAYQSRIVAG